MRVTPMPAQAAAKRCPICGKPAQHEYRPFCSKRCADVDLNRWFSGTYAVPAEDEKKDDAAPGQDDEPSG